MPPWKRPAAAAGGEAEPPSKRAKTQGLYVQYKGTKIPEPRVSRTHAASGFKVIAWNVGGLRTFLVKKSAVLQKLVRSEKPAVLGFMEHRLQVGSQVEDAVSTLSKLLPDYVVNTDSFYCSKEKKGYSGTVLIWRKDIAGHMKVKHVQLEKGTDEGRTLCLEFPKYFVVLGYVMNSGDGLKRLAERVDSFDPKLRGYLQGLKRKKPVLMLGDLNVAHRDEDIWNSEAPHVPKSACTSPEERDSFGKLLNCGFVDGFAHLHPKVRGAFTYWSVRAGNRPTNHGLRLDYALVSAGMVEGAKGKPQLLDAFHLPAFAPDGDHCPIGAILK